VLEAAVRQSVEGNGFERNLKVWIAGPVRTQADEGWTGGKAEVVCRGAAERGRTDVVEEGSVGFVGGHE